MYKIEKIENGFMIENQKGNKVFYPTLLEFVEKNIINDISSKFKYKQNIVNLEISAINIEDIKKSDNTKSF